MKNQNTRPQILLTNDDGINAPGIRALCDVMAEIGDCAIVAPVDERSACAHSITLHSPIRIEEINNGLRGKAWGVTGTPVDCVKIAVKEVLKKKPDLIVSGINQGSNTAINTIYSGTVAGAAEGSLMNIPSFAISIAKYDYHDFSVAAEFAKIMSKMLLENPLPEYTFLNINIPPVSKDEIQGVRITRQGKTRYNEIFDPREGSSEGSYWLRGEKILLEHSDDSDEIAVSKNFIAVTPLQYDLTDYKALDHLRTWNLKWINTK